MSQPRYILGHQESVLSSHSKRTASNSAAYLLPALLPTMHILDVGCGAGTITIDLATLVPSGRVIGMDAAESVVAEARKAARDKSVTNVEFVAGDVMKLDYPDNTFDVVHAHQVLQHLRDPVGALKEMRRVCKVGGLVATRTADMSAVIWFPEVDGLQEWLSLYKKLARSNGAEPDAGRRAVFWAKSAGFDGDAITATASAWCYSTKLEREWWSASMAERSRESSFHQSAVESGHATQEDLERIAKAWRTWGAHEDGWFSVLNGEILCKK